MAKLDLKKYKKLILHLANQLGGQIKGKKKLAKLLYFVDFDFYEKKEQSITGEEYRALPMGPFPMHLESAISELKKESMLSVSSVEEKEGYNPTEIYTAKGKPLDAGVFSEDELKIIDRVITKYGHLTGKQLEDLTHAEAPYIGTAPNQIIGYELSFYRGTDFSNGS